MRCICLVEPLIELYPGQITLPNLIGARMKWVIRGYCLALFLACLIPPWIQTEHRGTIHGSEPLRHSWIFSPPRPKASVGLWNFNPNTSISFSRNGISVSVDLSRLSFEILGLTALFGVGLSFTWRKGASS